MEWTQVKKKKSLVGDKEFYGSLGLESVCLSQGCKGCKEQKSLLFKNIHTFTHSEIGWNGKGAPGRLKLGTQGLLTPLLLCIALFLCRSTFLTLCTF